MRRSGRYPGQIQTVPLKIENAPRESFREQLEAIPFLAYEVEQISDGRSVCITKPGGKKSRGAMKAQDFMVWVYDQGREDRWRISHEEILDDLRSKMQTNPDEARRVIMALKRVHDGEEPGSVVAAMRNLGNGLPGESPELLLKVYKWIWGQEDCNYPSGEGRFMSMNPILHLLTNP